MTGFYVNAMVNFNEYQHHLDVVSTKLLGPTLEFHIPGSVDEAEVLCFPRFLTDNASSPSPSHLTPAVVTEKQ